MMPASKELTNLAVENYRMKKALERIERWDLPKELSSDGKYWVSYECNHGSNGAREYVRSIAREALE